MTPEDRRPVTEDELHAFADGLLPDGRRAAVEAHLAAHAGDAERVRSWTAATAALHSAFDGVLDEPVPARLAAAARPARRLAPRLAVAAAILAAGGAGWLLRGAVGPGAAPAAEAGAPLAHQAAVAHAVYVPEVRHPVEVGAAEEAHLVGWLSKRLGSSLRAPHLGGLGWDLLGGRLLPGDRGPVAQLMYADAAGRRLTLYVARAASGEAGTAFRFSQEGAVGVFTWVDRSMGYALSGELPRPELLRVADAVYAQIER